jgi:TonB-dependent starch-binding outer membrane protein SusC
MRTRKFQLSLCFILISVLLGAQDDYNNLSQKIKLKAGIYSIGAILEKLNSEAKINLTYNANEIHISEKVEVKQDNPTAKNLLEEICKQTPTEYQLVNEYIILKKRKLSLNYRIQGKVKIIGENEPTVGVNVYLSENLNGTVTDTNGEYSFSSSPGNYTLVFSSLGYEKQELRISLYHDIRMDATMYSTNTQIQEVKIVGQRQFFGDMNTGRTIESIGLKEIEEQNVNNASDLLHARFAGVWATKTSGLPGDHQKIRIRGLNSMFASVDPLYIIDGVPVPIVNLSSLGIADLNIHDIENVTILKEASSTALYGFQGGNGVVLIETKQGGAKEINFSTKFGVQRFTHYYNLMGAKEFLASMDSSKRIFLKKQRDYYPKYSDTLSNTNWQDVIFQDGLIQEYQLAVSGENKKNRYYLSGNYLNHQGIISGSLYKRYTFSSNLTHTFYKFFQVSFNYKGSYQNNQNNQDSYMGNRIIFEGINKSPCLESTPDSLYNNSQIRIYYNYLPLQNTESTQDYIEKNNCTLKNLSNTFSGSAQFRFKENLFLNLAGSLLYKRNLVTIAKELYYLQSTEDYITINQQISLNYNKSFGGNNIGFCGAFRNYKDNIWWNIDSISTLNPDELPESFYPRNTMSRYGKTGSVIRSIQSYIGHISYNYNNKYFISVAADYDRIKEGFNTDKQVLFPSVAINWDVAQETPFKRVKWLNNFNIFTNWGISGNFPLNSLTNDLYTQVNTSYGNQTTSNPTVSQLANHRLKHEQIEEYNVGAKVSFLNSRVSLNFVYYEKTNSNLIVLRDIPLYYGGGSQYYNINELFNRGYEYGIEIIPVENQNFRWLTAFNYSTYNQIVSKLMNDSSIYFYDDDILVPDFVIEENEPLGSIFGYKILGRWDPTVDSPKNRNYRNRENLKVLNADSSDLYINKKDKVIIGNSVPNYTWNFYTSLSYKNFEFDFLWYAVVGVDKFNATRAGTIMAGTNSEINSYIGDTIKTFDDKVFYESSIFVEDASFIRLKSLSISYEPSKMLFARIKARFSLSFENLITITKYKGYDPEATIYTDNNFTDNSIDRGAFPNPKAIYATINLKF